MFEYTITHWATFLTAAVLLNLSPGPDMVFILGQTARGGRRGGFAALFGVWTGVLAHVVMAAIGLSAILATSALAFTIVKWIGAIYLIWLGIQALLSRGSSLVPDSNEKQLSGKSIYWQGVIVATLNPKVAVFFLAFLPQFVVEGAGPAGAQLFLHGILIILVATVIEPPMVMAGSRLIQSLRNNKSVSLWLDRTLGTLFIGLGLRLAITDRS